MKPTTNNATLLADQASWRIRLKLRAECS